MKTIFEEDFRGLFKMDKIYDGSLFKQVFAKVSFWVHFTFLIYINELFNNSKSNVKLFADYVSLFTVVKDKNESANVLKNYLQSFSIWAYKLKMIFNPDSSKPVQEVLF